MIVLIKKKTKNFTLKNNIQSIVDIRQKVIIYIYKINTHDLVSVYNFL